MKSPPSSKHGIAHPVKTWPSSLVSRFPHFSGYRAALFRPRDCIKRRFRRFYRLTVKRRAATRPACGMEVRLIPRRPSTASRQCPHLGDAGLWRACRPHPWSQWSARPILRQTPATYEHIFRKRLFSACHPLHSDTDIQWIAQRPSSPQFDRPYHYPSKAWSFGTLITGRVLRHFPPECRRQLPQSGLRSENVRFRDEGFIEIFKCLAVAASLIRAKVAEPPACHHRRKSMGQFGSRTPSRKPSKTSGRNRGIRRNEGGPLSDHQSAFSPIPQSEAQSMRSSPGPGFPSVDPSAEGPEPLVRESLSLFLLFRPVTVRDKPNHHNFPTSAPSGTAF